MSEGSKRFLILAAIAALVFGGGYYGYKNKWFGGGTPTFVQNGPPEVRLAHWTWNAHQGWALANKGLNGSPDSIFAQKGVTVKFFRIEEIPNQIAAMKTYAKRFKGGEANPTEGANFFTIMGDSGGMVLNEANKALRDIDPNYRAEIVGASGFSYGEDKFMGPPEWKKNPQSSLGGLVAGVPADGDWNIMILWAAQNNIPFNADPKLYNPGALNFLATEGYVQAGEIYNANKPVELRFTADGKDFQGNPVVKGDKGMVQVSGLVTWTPVDKVVAENRGGVVSIVSTREYSNQMPQVIIGFKQWNQRNSEVVEKTLAGIFEANDLIIRADRQLLAGQIAAKSAQDYRWSAAQYVQELFGDQETPDFWYRYYSVFKMTDKQGLQVEIGGSQVANLQRNIKYFGLDGGTNIGQSVYERFSKLAKQYYPDFVDNIYPWNEVFNAAYLNKVAQQYPNLAQAPANLPAFSAEGVKRDQQVGQLTYRFNFDSGSANFLPGAETTLKQLLSELTIAANTKVEIHGYTDSSGAPDANFALSGYRGNAVYSWLQRQSGSSFPANRVAVVPHGQGDLVQTDRRPDGSFDEDAGAKNRRVVVKIYRQ